MNPIVSFFLFICVLFSCTDPEREMERETMACFIEVAAYDNVDLDSLIDAIEINLIHKGQLKGRKGSDYIDFLEKINIENKTSHLAKHQSSVSLLALHDLFIFQKCTTRFDHKAYKGSTAQKLDSAMLELVHSKNIYPNTFSTVFLNTMNEADFEEPFYKVIFWKVYAEIFISGPDISGFLPVKEYKKDVDLDSNCLSASIGIAGTDIIYWNDQEILIDHLEDSVSTLIKSSIKVSTKTKETAGFGNEKCSNYVLYLSPKPETSYGLYLTIQNVIVKCINDLRNETALRLYNQTYFTLDTERVEIVETIIESRLIETSVY